jgi:hypothetical protein
LGAKWAQNPFDLSLNAGTLVSKDSRINVNFAVRSDHPYTKRSGDMVYTSWLD